MKVKKKLRRLKKIGLLGALLCMFICSLNVQAQCHPKVNLNKTVFNEKADGGSLDSELDVISVRELELDGVMPNANNGGVYKSIEVVYNGTITPSTTYTYEYTSNNIRYRGNLSLASYSHKNGTTIATYDGYTYPMN